MKLLKQLTLILTIVFCVSFIYQNESLAQTTKQTESANLTAIKNKRKVYIFAQSPAAQNEIAQALKTINGLEVVNKPEDAEFFISESVTFKSSTSKLPYSTNDSLIRLQQPPGEPQSKQQQTMREDAINPSKERIQREMKTTIEVYFVKDDGTKALVWSKDSIRKVSSEPQSTIPQTNQRKDQPTDVLPEGSFYYKSSDEAVKLTKIFVKSLKAVN
jgi:hypothetical protein